MITDFTYGLGSGLSAATQNPVGRGLRTEAGMGAILQQPKVLQDAKIALAQKTQEENDRKAQILAGILGQQQQGQQAAAQLAETQRLHSIEQAKNQADQQNQIVDNAREATKLELEKGSYVPIGEAKPTAEGVMQVYAPKFWDGQDTSKLVKYKVGDAPDKVTTPKSLQNDEFVLKDGSHAELSYDPTPTPARPAGTYIDPKTSKDVTDQVVGKYHAPSSTDSNDVLIQYSEDGVNKQGLLNKTTRKISEVQTPGSQTAGPKLAEPPAAIKTQGTAATTALRQVSNITDILNQNPQLVGPVAGRFQEFMQGVGKNPFVGTKDERMGAQLAEHLNALFAQELRSMFPGRTNAQMQDIIKSTSARMKQDPNMMMGFLEGIKINEGMVLETAKAQGFVEDRFAKPASAAAPTVRPRASDGKGNFVEFDGTKWVPAK
jgi:hypothetical protein